MGRPSKYTPKAVKTIVEMIEKGASRETAAQAAGITYTTLREWELDESKPEFSRAIKTAKEKFLDNLEADHLANIALAAMQGPNYWHASAWLLERNFEQYKLKTDTTVKHSGEIKIPKLRWADEE